MIVRLLGEGQFEIDEQAFLVLARRQPVASDLRFVIVVERIFGLWGYVAAWLLWRGHIVNNPAMR